ncbi:hypothetical protein Hanom_Chr05g00444661 [Helianthus anomalus]
MHKNDKFNRYNVLEELEFVKIFRISYCWNLEGTLPLNGSDLLLVQHLMVQTVCFASRCPNGSDICL